MNISRRHLLATVPLMSAAALLAGCATATVNGVTTITLNLDTVNNYAEAIQNGANTLLGISLVTAAMGPTVAAAVKAAVTDAAAAIAALDAANKGAVSFSFTTASVPAALAALQQDAATIGNAAAAVVTSLGSQVSSTVLTIVQAIQTIVAVLGSLITGAVGAPNAKMTPAQALAVLGVKA